jgi:hypothetical protein
VCVCVTRIRRSLLVLLANTQLNEGGAHRPRI